MIDKSNGCAPNSNGLQPSEGNDVDVPNFKLLYRNMNNSEREKSSGESSDEETTSSSLIPIPDSLRQMKNKLKQTVSDTEHSGSAYNVPEILEKPTEILRNSLEELRKKYTLKTETSVALKMNSANLILDDILNSANLNVTANDNFQFCKQQEIKSKTLSENETSTTESSISVTKHYPHISDHPHPIAYDFFLPSCPWHGSFPEPLHNSPVKGSFTPKEKVETPKKKKTLMEMIQDLQIKGKIQSVYRSLQRTKNPFAKEGKESEVMQVQEGKTYPASSGNLFKFSPQYELSSSGVGHHENRLSICKCPKKHPLKKLDLDLLESSEFSQSESKGSEWEGHHCTCFNQRECSCPEVIPQCNCAAIYIENYSKHPKQSSLESEVSSIINSVIHEKQSSRTAAQKKENETIMLPPKDNQDSQDNKNQQNYSKLKKHHGESKRLTKERRIIERTDIYYFDHGNSAYYQTTDNHPLRYTESLVERTDHYATKFWAEIFGTIEIGVAFLISFFLQFYRFLFTSLIRSLTIGLLQISSDYFIKPFLTIIFNGLIQPCLILAYNIATSVRDLCLPISQIFGFFTKEVAGLLRSFRIVEINREKQISCNCGNKV